MSNSGGVPGAPGQTGGGGLADLQVFSGSSWVPLREPGDYLDGVTGANIAAVQPYALSSGTLFDRLRTPAVFKSGPVTAAGSTGQWTPAAGKKFRLMKYQMILTGQATIGVAGNLVIDLLDSATSLGLAVSMFVPAAAVNTLGGFATPWFDLGNGILSAVANNVLNVSLNVALTAGQLRVITIGTEE